MSTKQFLIITSQKYQKKQKGFISSEFSTGSENSLFTFKWYFKCVFHSKHDSGCQYCEWIFLKIFLGCVRVVTKRTSLVYLFPIKRSFHLQEWHSNMQLNCTWPWLAAGTLAELCDRPCGCQYGCTAVHLSVLVYTCLSFFTSVSTRVHLSVLLYICQY